MTRLRASVSKWWRWWLERLVIGAILLSIPAFILVKLLYVPPPDEQYLETRETVLRHLSLAEDVFDQVQEAARSIDGVTLIFDESEQPGYGICSPLFAEWAEQDTCSMCGSTSRRQAYRTNRSYEDIVLEFTPFLEELGWQENYHNLSGQYLYSGPFDGLELILDMRHAPEVQYVEQEHQTTYDVILNFRENLDVHDCVAETSQWMAWRMNE